MGRDRRGRVGGRDCPRFREAISARLDSEDPGMAAEVIEAHLARCPDCRHFAEVAAREHRRLRVRPAGPVPDLTEEILEQLSSMPPPAVAAAGGAGAGGAGMGGAGTGGAGARGAGRPAAGVGRGRRRVASLAAAVVVVVGAGFGAGALIGDHLGGSPNGAIAGGQAGGSKAAAGRYPGATVMTAGVPKPGVVLTDTSGRPYDLARATAGRVTLVYFGYTHCPDLCPINMALTASALRDLPAAERRKIAVVFITTDPSRDTRQVIRAWLDRFSSTFVGLTGSMAAIHAAEVQVQMPLSYLDRGAGGRAASSSRVGQDYQVVHAGYTLVYASDGRANLTVDDAARPDQYAVTLSHVLTYGFRRAA